MSQRWIVLGALALGLARAQSSDVCAGCHRGIWETYRKTGMARSFYVPTAANTVENLSATFYHRASDSYFQMLWRAGKMYQRRYQLDAAGAQINAMEKRVDYVMGSGNHARAYLHRTARNTLVELPLAWYTEKGGYWGMNPGYDRVDHKGFRRPITYDCMFCHNAYPQGKTFAEPVYGATLPQGIDCARCHGPGAKHVDAAKRAGARVEEIRRAIVNPSRLSADRQMEVCMQCHLETTSFPLPNSLPRYGRGPFSYRVGEPLADFLLTFDHAAGTGREEKFEIVNAAYRLRRSACFLKSGGALRCTTCHNPHDIPRGEVAARHYTEVCKQCHGGLGKHMGSDACVDCHMPKRRTEDVVHVVATDHFIQRRRPAGDLLGDLAERYETDAEAYRGPVALYYPEKLPRTPENDLDLAVAQVIQKSNLTAGIPQLTAAIAQYSPKRPEYYLELAEALRNNGQLEKALPMYREAIRRDPRFVPGLQKLGSALRRAKNYRESVQYLKRAAALAPDDANPWHELGLTYRAQGDRSAAIAALQKAIALDPDLPEAHNNLGILRLSDADFLEAIRIQPDYADAHSNLATLLAGKGEFAQARQHFETALRMRPEDAPTRYNFAMLLGQIRDFDGAQRELEASLRTDPQLVDAHLLLADLLMAKGQARDALPHYAEAVRMQPGLGRAHLGLGTALAATGDVAGAVPHLRKAAADADPAVRGNAGDLLRQLQR